uniref:Uncharacterized protein n=1 Tax=Molossus molossus TaxID=27622 RepID=A0A7J8JXH3_MOLMO|nr:hypothetical protein HJG59_008126 [Molossus molossus]
MWCVGQLLCTSICWGAQCPRICWELFRQSLRPPSGTALAWPRLPALGTLSSLCGLLVFPGQKWGGSALTPSQAAAAGQRRSRGLWSPRGCPSSGSAADCPALVWTAPGPSSRRPAAAYRARDTGRLRPPAPRTSRLPERGSWDPGVGVGERAAGPSAGRDGPSWAGQEGQRGSWAPDVGHPSLLPAV